MTVGAITGREIISISKPNHLNPDNQQKEGKHAFEMPDIESVGELHTQCCAQHGRRRQRRARPKISFGISLALTPFCGKISYARLILIFVLESYQVIYS